MTKKAKTPEELQQTFILMQIADWAKYNGYSLKIPDVDAEIDFVNINFKNKEIYIGNMGDTDEPV